MKGRGVGAERQWSVVNGSSGSLAVIRSKFSSLWRKFFQLTTRESKVIRSHFEFCLSSWIQRTVIWPRPCYAVPLSPPSQLFSNILWNLIEPYLVFVKWVVYGLGAFNKAYPVACLPFKMHCLFWCLTSFNLVTWLHPCKMGPKIQESCPKKG